MKVEKYDGSQECRILTGMVVDEKVLARITDKWRKDGLFQSNWCNLVGEWCINFFNKYGRAPGKSIEGLFESWAQDNSDKNTIKLVESFLTSLSGDHEQLAEDSNSDYVVDLAANYFNRVKYRRLVEAIQGDLDNGDLDKAETRLGSFSKLEMGVGAGIDVMFDQDAVRTAFEDKREPLITYPGELGVFFRDALERDALIAIMAPEKRAKSWWLMDIAWRAMLGRRKVAMFQVGDMSQNQIMRRLMIRAIRRPLKPKKYNYPIALTHEKGTKFAAVEHEEREVKDEIAWQDAWKACQEIMQHKVKSKESLFKLSCHPNSTMNVSGIRDILRGWERHGWVPDVIVIDYADILAPEAGSHETRDQINATWKALRALSQILHCLVVTATQSDADSYNADVITRRNFTDDKRKNAHVTGMLALNVSDEEKQVGLTRLNWVQLREEEFSERKCVHVAGCLSIGNPAIRSVW